MLERGKISSLQMAIIMYPTILATGFIVLPSITAQGAHNDFWLTGLIPILSGIIAILVSTRLHEFYPQQTVIQASEQILGKIAGKIIGMGYLLFFLINSGFIVREYADFVKGNFLFKTPLLLIISVFILLAAIAVRGGLEMLTRSSVLFTIIFCFPLFFLLLLIPELDLRNIFPFLHHGITPVIKSAATPIAWTSEFFLITFFLPCLTDPAKAKKFVLISLLTVIMSLTYVNLITLFLLGTDIGNKSYPILVAFRYIRIGNFFENLESLLLAMWIVGNFVKIGVFYYATVLTCAQNFQLSDYRSTVFPIGILIIVFSLLSLPSLSVLVFYIKYVAPFYIVIYMILIPVLLLFIAKLRKSFNRESAR
ncbi:endospore germination permease [Paenibacillus sp. CGMCC 1.16610]|uniref:Endospore germination permease n=2 Tax=Paenibacillus anseongense TaxID=2682845 RepID=A0ABW9UKK3_9BACL|nr:endospore germination permease [Paenibacillus sp. CGMCC 1.16610]MBA2939856.1 endospore germination permease [Paenibacillus sp. CGMCC 1.16610]MVQ39516.1 endospore germination permease [Paenibacillus anseongense]